MNVNEWANERTKEWTWTNEWITEGNIFREIKTNKRNNQSQSMMSSNEVKPCWLGMWLGHWCTRESTIQSNHRTMNEANRRKRMHFHIHSPILRLRAHGDPFGSVFERMYQRKMNECMSDKCIQMLPRSWCTSCVIGRRRATKYISEHPKLNTSK